MSESPLVFPNVSAGEWACIQQKAGDRGFALSSDSGELEQMGVTIRWTYDGAAQTLTFTTVNKPVFVPQSMVEAQLRNLIDSSGCLAPKP